MGAIVFGVMLFVFSIFSITVGMQERFDSKGYVLKTEVKDVFKNVDWTKQTFTTNGVLLKDHKGNELFYPCKEIDEAIKKLNERLWPF